MCAERLPFVLGQMRGPASLLRFVIRHCQLRVIESPDSTSANNEERVISPPREPGGRVVLGRFSQQVSISAACQVLPPVCAAGSVCCPAALEVAGPPASASRPPTRTCKGRLREPLSQSTLGPCSPGTTPGPRKWWDPWDLLCGRADPVTREWCSLNTRGLCQAGEGTGMQAGSRAC